MTKKEKILYKDGRKNSNGYKYNPFDFFEKKWIPIVLSILIPIALVISLLELLNVTSWNKIFSSVGIINGTQVVEEDFVVYCLDVGQSDCTIIVCDNVVMMIDTGTLNQVYNIRTSLYTLGIDKVDYMVITHPHDDHISGASDIIENYDVSNILMPSLNRKNTILTPTYLNLLDSIEKHNVNPISISAGYSFNLGSSYVEILSPMKQDEELNNMSAVIKITYGNTKMLFQGDTDDSVEKQLLMSDYDITADILKVGHHGSNTSSSGAFLDVVNPEFAIISSGPDNNYGHPNTYVIERLEERNIKPYITSLNGDITIVSDGNDLLITTKK